MKLQNTLSEIRDKNTSRVYISLFNYIAWAMMHTDGVQFSKFWDKKRAMLVNE